MKALDRSDETLGLWIVTSSVTFIKSVNQSSSKPCLLIYFHFRKYPIMRNLCHCFQTTTNFGNYWKCKLWTILMVQNGWRNTEMIRSSFVLLMIRGHWRYENLKFWWWRNLTLHWEMFGSFDTLTLTCLALRSCWIQYEVTISEKLVAGSFQKLGTSWTWPSILEALTFS